MAGWVTVSAVLTHQGSQELGTAATVGQFVLQGAVPVPGIGSGGLQLQDHGNLGYSGSAMHLPFFLDSSHRAVAQVHTHQEHLSGLRICLWQGRRRGMGGIGFC